MLVRDRYDNAPKALASGRRSSRPLIEALRALEEGFPPGAMVEVPVDRAGDAFARVVQRTPFELVFRERRIDRITAVMPETVGHERDQALRFAEPAEN